MPKKEREKPCGYVEYHHQGTWKRQNIQFISNWQGHKKYKFRYATVFFIKRMALVLAKEFQAEKRNEAVFKREFHKRQKIGDAWLILAAQSTNQ